MNARSNIVPEPRFAALKSKLAERLAWAGASVRPDNFAALLDPLMRQVLQQGFDEARADEGTVWLLDGPGEHLVPAHNTGPHADRLVGKFQQPLDAGLICMVFASEQPFVENDVQQNAQQSKLLDATLGLQTVALIAVPFCFLNACRGVVSCVQLKTPGSSDPDPPGFGPAALNSIQRATAVLSRLVELRLIGSTIGWTTE